MSNKGSFDNSIRLWTKDGAAAGQFNGHTDSVNCLIRLPGGRLASGSDDKTIRIWNTNGTTKILRGHRSEVTHLSLLSNENLASASADGEIILWPQDGGAIKVLQGHDDQVTCLIVSSDGRLISGSADHTIRLWNPDGTPANVLQGHTGSVTCVIELSGGWLASGSEDGTIRQWTPDGETNAVFKRKYTESAVTCLTLVPNRKGVAVGYEDGRVLVWKTTSDHESTNFKHAKRVTCLITLPDGRFVSGSDDGMLFLWDNDRGHGAKEMATHTHGVTCLTLLSDGQLASGAWDNTIRFWDVTPTGLVNRAKQLVQGIDYERSLQRKIVIQFLTGPDCAQLSSTCTALYDQMRHIDWITRPRSLWEELYRRDFLISAEKADEVLYLMPLAPIAKSRICSQFY